LLLALAAAEVAAAVAEQVDILQQAQTLVLAQLTQLL
jgi:hypothetical protein